jgi:hypothetical protein
LRSGKERKEEGKKGRKKEKRTHAGPGSVVLELMRGGDDDPATAADGKV